MSGPARIILGCLISAPWFLPACGSDEIIDGFPSEYDIHGTYEATILTVRENGSTTDVLAEGGALTITLAPEGDCYGTFVVPANHSESGIEEVYDMGGTWSLRDSVITFDQSADTFVRDAKFSVPQYGRLEADETFGDTTITIVLVQH